MLHLGPAGENPPARCERGDRAGRRAGALGTTFAVLAAGLGLTAGAAGAQTGADPLLSQQWGLYQLRVPEAWRASRGSGAVIAVIDGAVDTSHPDLAGRLVGGADFLRNDDGKADLTPHATHVAAIAAGAAGNGTGIAGVAPEAMVMPLRAMSAAGTGTAVEIAAAVDHAVANGAHVISLSLGREVPLTGSVATLSAALERANGAGVVVVAAAGNERTASSPDRACAFPGAAPGVVCVAATDRREQLSGFSNFPVKTDQIAVSAPGGSGLPGCGENVLSATTRGTSSDGARCGYGPDHGELAGTSQAVPFVSGVAALLRSKGLDRDATIAALTSTARQPVTGQRGVYTRTYGYGIVDAAAAVGLGVAATSRTGTGYSLASADGRLFNFGTTPNMGPAAGRLSATGPVVALADSPDGDGQLLATADGGVHAVGQARIFGSLGGTRLNRPIVGLAPTPDGGGYWLVASDGGIFAFGNARFFGSTAGGSRLIRPVVAFAAS